MSNVYVCTICGVEEGSLQGIYENGRTVKGICNECKKEHACPSCEESVYAFNFIQHLMNHGWPYAKAAQVMEAA